MTKAYSENGEDIWIMENVKLPERGFYMDIGCASPWNENNTAFLRDRGWQGVGIDANIGWAHLWKTHFICAIVSDEAVVPFRFKQDTGTSRVENGAMLFGTTTIDRLMPIDRTLDFLSLDLEGHEYEALCSMTLTKHRPQIIVSEYVTKDVGEDYRVRDYLLANGYKLGHQTANNMIFIA